MALIANPKGHTQAVRLAQSIRLFGMQTKILSRLHDANYRSALMLCRRALAFEQEYSETKAAPVAGFEQLDARKPLLELLALLNSLRLEVRTRIAG